MTDQKLLEEFATGFFGYGNPKAKIWFVGYEEGFPRKKRNLNPSKDELKKAMFDQAIVRANVWSELEKNDILDIQTFHKKVAVRLANKICNKWFEDFDKWFNEPYPTQSTWRGLIYFFLKFQGWELPDKPIEQIRECQQSYWGREYGNVCLLEMYGLPNPNQTCWIYDCFESREKSAEKFRPKRHRWFQKQLNKKTGPTLVIFYKNDPLSVCHWSKICQVSEWKFRQEIRYAKKGKTLFICIPHPSSRGIGYNYWGALAEGIAELAPSTQPRW